MKVIAKGNIESLKYGTIVKGSEVDIDSKVGEIWIKQGLAYGKDEVHDSLKGDTRVKEKAK